MHVFVVASSFHSLGRRRDTRRSKRIRACCASSIHEQLLSSATHASGLAKCHGSLHPLRRLCGVIDQNCSNSISLSQAQALCSLRVRADGSLWRPDD